VPFTPYHLGPNGVVGLGLRKRLDLPALLLVNVAVDVEPLLVILGLRPPPVHGLSHTLLGATAIGLLFGLAVHGGWGLYLRGVPRRWAWAHRPTLGQALLGSGVGAWLHVLTDMLIYGDVHPLGPLVPRPFPYRWSYPEIAALCGALGAVALVWGLWLLARRATR